MTITVAANAKQAFYEPNSGTVQISSTVPRWPYAGEVTPGEVTGARPIHVPTYGGDIDHILVLDKNWVVVSVNPMEKLFDEIDTLSAGALQTDYDTWIASAIAENANYTARGNMQATRNTHLPAAKTTVEVPLGVAGNFDITSSDDAFYSTAQNPNQCGKIYVSVGGDVTDGTDTVYIQSLAKAAAQPGAFQINHRVYSYLEMPQALVSGDTYTITYGTDTVTFLFDEDETVSRAIKINQLGYIDDAGVKKAYLGANLWQFGQLDLAHATTYEVINRDTGATANSGSVTLVEANPLINETLASGTATSGTTSTTLIDSGASFLTTAVAGNFVNNTTDTTRNEIVTVVSDTELTLNSSIFVVGETYNVVKYYGVANDDQFCGEDVYEIDFSALTTAGEYYIKVPGVGRSWPFKITSTIFSELYYKSMRQFYRLRAGSEHTTKYTAWAKRKAKLGPYIYESEAVSFPPHDANSTPSGYSDFNVIGGTILYNTQTEQVPGGWHDAADWDTSLWHLGSAFAMMYAYEFNSANLIDDQLDLPESGDGIPDILSEARHGLEMFRLSDLGDGGIMGRCETWTHPTIASPWDSTLTYPKGGADKTDYTFGTRTRWAALAYAAAAAQYARLVFAFDSTDSALYEQSAVDAYDFGNNASNSLGVDFDINYVDNRGAGPGSGVYTITETDSWIDPYWMHAKLQLWLLTGTDTYITNAPSVATLEARVQAPYVWRWGRKDWSPWIHYSIIQASDAGYTGLDSLATTWTNWFKADADALLLDLATPPYPCTFDRNRVTAMGFGNTNMFIFNISLLIADKLTARVDSKYYDAALQNVDYALGCNPLGMSWTTGIGYTYPVNLQDIVSDQDLIFDPRPGITLYGLDDLAAYLNFRHEVIARFGGANTGITQTAGTATVTTAAPHGLSNGDKIIISYANGSNKIDAGGYNIRGTVANKTASTFEYAVDSGLATASSGGNWYYDFLTDDAQDPVNNPMWRRFSIHNSYNVAQSEFTHHESMASVLFTAAVLLDYSAPSEIPRPGEYLWGRWPLP